MGVHRRFSFRTLGALCAAPLCLASAAARAEEEPAPPSDPGRPVVVELFLSQACNMCPPAAALFHDIAARPGVVALSFHVDYWNMMDTEKGRWADPLSKSEFTKRQKRYNINIRNRSSIYTPQAVVGGETQTVGSKKEKVSVLIDAAEPAPARVETEIRDGEVVFTVARSKEGGNAYLVTFKRRTSTNVTAGGNAGKVFDEVNVVTDMRPLGIVRRRGAEITAPAPAPDEGCALIVQEPQQRRIVAAAYCPI